MSFAQSASNLPSFNIRYSSFLGMLYLSTQESEKAIADVKKEIGEADVKKGYQGYQGDTPSARALKVLSAQGIRGGELSGVLTSARIVEREISGGKKAPYLNVGFKSADGRYYLSVQADHAGAQLLIRKLVNASPDTQTFLKMFGTYGTKPGATQAYGEHGASLKQAEAEVPGVNPAEELKARVEVALNALKTAGVTDKEILNKQRDQVTLAYHLELMTSVEQKFKDFYEARQQQPEDEVPADHASSTAE